MSTYLRRNTWFALGVMCAFFVAQATVAASFDCAKAGTKVEKLICGDAELSTLDDDLNAAYKTAVQDKKQADNIKQAQKRWMKERNGCADADCVKQAYDTRLAMLTQNYTLVMSKDTRLCNAMLALYNNDMKAYKRIWYDRHEIFSSIEWQTDDDLDIEHAFFDINNDGKNELVIKKTWHLRGIGNEALYIYSADSDVLSKLRPGAGGLHALSDNSIELFSTHNNVYYLKALPATEVGAEVFFVLNPFIWEGASYISITDQTPRWIVIAKYKQAEELQDICYFFNPSIKHQ